MTSSLWTRYFFYGCKRVPEERCYPPGPSGRTTQVPGTSASLSHPLPTPKPERNRPTERRQLRVKVPVREPLPKEDDVDGAPWGLRRRHRISWYRGTRVFCLCSLRGSSSSGPSDLAESLLTRLSSLQFLQTLSDTPRSLLVRLTFLCSSGALGALRAGFPNPESRKFLK